MSREIVKEAIGVKTETSVKKSTKNVIITIDTDVKDIVKLDSEGVSLSFESSPGKFKHLSEDVLGLLSKMNVSSYWVSYGLMRKEQDQIYSTDGIKISPRDATATHRTNVTITDPDWGKKWHLCWKRPDQLQKAKSDGYQVVAKTDPVAGFARNPSGLITVGVAGDDELVLMKVPQDIFLAIKRSISNESRRRGAAIKDQYNDQVERLGGKTVNPNDPRFNR